jgi:phosphohistidine phosphatase
MELILWRHAEAEEPGGRDDMARELTKRGRKQAERMAHWLQPRIDPSWRILVSPATRTLQTVKPLGREYEVSESVGLSANARGVLAEADWPRAERSVLVVGHQPTLGEVASVLLLGDEGAAAVRKGSIWWFASRSREGRMEATLKAVLAPELLETQEPR